MAEQPPGRPVSIEYGGHVHHGTYSTAADLVRVSSALGYKEGPRRDAADPDPVAQALLWEIVHASLGSRSPDAERPSFEPVVVGAGAPTAALSERQLSALRNLARKQAGEEVDWINISDARALTELGLAARNQEGWRITPAGLSALHNADADGV